MGKVDIPRRPIYTLQTGKPRRQFMLTLQLIVQTFEVFYSQETGHPCYNDAKFTRRPYSLSSVDTYSALKP